MNDSLITTESFILLCRKCDLYRADIEDMTIGMCLDYIEEYIEMNNPTKNRKREASQQDFDSF